jgi:hypothetical protein
MIVHPLFHWSPTDRRPAIQRRGLIISSRPVCTSVRTPLICLSQSPSQAWALSAAVFGERGQEWDCWQIALDPADEVEVRPFFGNRVEEFRVRNNIPKSRVWLVGTRTVPKRGKRT